MKKKTVTLQVWTQVSFSLWLFATVVAVFSAACARNYSESVEYGPAPLLRVEVFGSRITFYIQQDARIEDLVDLEYFRGFWPGMTIAEAERMLGPPDEVVRDLHGRSYEYKREFGRVVLSFEKHESWPAQSKGRWHLRAYPSDQSLRRTFDVSITSRLAERTSGRREVVVMKADSSRPAVWAILDGDQVQSVRWCSK